MRGSLRGRAVDDSRTHLELSHIAHPEEHWEQFGPGAAGIGWDLGLLGLQLHIATGADQPVESGDWPTTPEGLRFMTGSGHAWYDADVAGSADPEAARAAADRTIAFYTQPPPEE